MFDGVAGGEEALVVDGQAVEAGLEFTGARATASGDALLGDGDAARDPVAERDGRSEEGGVDGVVAAADDRPGGDAGTCASGEFARRDVPLNTRLLSPARAATFLACPRPRPVTWVSTEASRFSANASLESSPRSADWNAALIAASMIRDSS